MWQTFLVTWPARSGIPLVLTDPRSAPRIRDRHARSVDDGLGPARQSAVHARSRETGSGGLGSAHGGGAPFGKAGAVALEARGRNIRNAVDSRRFGVAMWDATTSSSGMEERCPVNYFVLIVKFFAASANGATWRTGCIESSGFESPLFRCEVERARSVTFARSTTATRRNPGRRSRFPERVERIPKLRVQFIGDEECGQDHFT